MFRASCDALVLRYRLVHECACADIAPSNMCTSCRTNSHLSHKSCQSIELCTLSPARLELEGNSHYIIQSIYIYYDFTIIIDMSAS